MSNDSTSQKELILYQLANLINSMCYYSVPAKLWDGEGYPEDLLEPMDALTQTGKLEYFVRGLSKYEQNPTEIVIPGKLLSDAAELVVRLDNMT
jgi:hypothetical protein